MGPADGLSATAVAPRRWGHPEPLLGIAVEAARSRISGVINRVGNAVVRLQRRFRASIAQGPRIFCRRHAKVALEDPLEVVRGIADCLGDFGQCRRFVGAFDELDGLCDCLAVAAHLVGPAPQARAIARCLGFRATREELDMLSLWAARRAAWLAIDAGRLDRTDDPAVRTPVTAHEGRPGRVRIKARHVVHRS